MSQNETGVNRVDTRGRTTSVSVTKVLFGPYLQFNPVFPAPRL